MAATLPGRLANPRKRKKRPLIYRSTASYDFPLGKWNCPLVIGDCARLFLRSEPLFDRRICATPRIRTHSARRLNGEDEFDSENRRRRVAFLPAPHLTDNRKRVEIPPVALRFSISTGWRRFCNRKWWMSSIYALLDFNALYIRYTYQSYS